jgi:hypothetical protein
MVTLRTFSEEGQVMDEGPGYEDVCEAKESRPRVPRPIISRMAQTKSETKAMRNEGWEPMPMGFGKWAMNCAQ